MAQLRLILVMILTLALTGCRSHEATPVTESPKPAEASSPATPPAHKENLPKITIFGDSLTAGYGLRPGESYPSLLQKKLDAEGFRYEVVIAGVSGDTSEGGLKRIESSLVGDLRIFVLELGANDIYHSLPITEMKNNLGEIIKRVKAHGAKVLLVGIEAPAALDTGYRKEVREAYQSLVREHRVAFIPSILDGVAGIDSLNQGDGLHPNAEGARIVADSVYNHLVPLLERVPAAPTQRRKGQSG